MGQIGPWWNMWVTPDTAGVPTCGMIGDPAGFVEAGAPYGFKLAWSCLWDAFMCYSEPAPGMYQTEHCFYDNKACKPLPVLRAHVDLFRQLRELDKNLPVSVVLGDLRRKRKEREELDRRVMAAAMQFDVMRETRSTLGLRTRPTTLVMPSRRLVRA